MTELTWKKSDESRDGYKTEMAPVTEEEQQKLVFHASRVHEAFKNEYPDFGYNAPSVKLLSDSISARRLLYSEDEKVMVANLFGAFLGVAIITGNNGLMSRWIKMKGDFGILFTNGDQQRIVFPINRVFRHIEEGEAYSVFSLFSAMQEFLATGIA